MIVSKPLLLPSPLQTLQRLFVLASGADFWLSVVYSIARVILGLILGILTGILLAAASSLSSGVKTLVKPIITLARTTPVASFILLAFIWIGESAVPCFITMLMVIPIIYENIVTAVEGTDKRFYEVAEIFKFTPVKKLKMLYIPTIKPYFTAGVINSIGLSFKAGIAAEVLCTPGRSIGEKLYESKLYLETQDLFAWTAVVIIISLILEKAVIGLIKRRREEKPNG